MRRRVSTDLRPTAGRAASVSRRARPRRPRRSAQGPVPPNFYARALRCAPESTAAALRAQHVVAAQRMPLRSQLDPARHRACADERPLHGRLAPYRVGRAASASRRARPHCPRRSAQGPVPPNFYARALPSPPLLPLARSTVSAWNRGDFVPRASPGSSLDTGLAQRNGRPTSASLLAPRAARDHPTPPATPCAQRLPPRLDSTSAPPRSACSPRLKARASVGPAQSHARIWPRFMWDKRGTQRSSGSGAWALRASPSLARRKSSAAARARSSPPLRALRRRNARRLQVPRRRRRASSTSAAAAASPPPLAPRTIYLQRSRARV
ncbi:hypothetical protein B0H15DRAFT_854131 [Mycena belliarum]|uniref:Uncharacterized protein n=1 Tax=Mycena belliarum TaxID=1033014 RepID=A0AAD6U1F4_9AGAR|nr:hypothetical protein B0H15DRAFT_853993 [Mycena belliae]KAJ7081565.1 hypothetical protein B0H15DRAFT_854131 [Mycena belliae]